MQRQEIWLVSLSYATAGVFFVYVIAHNSRFEYDLVASIGGILGLGMASLAFLGLLKR